jgi:hypothetical protein
MIDFFDKKKLGTILDNFENFKEGAQQPEFFW